jgi:hypothetical protein
LTPSSFHKEKSFLKAAWIVIAMLIAIPSSIMGNQTYATISNQTETIDLAITPGASNVASDTTSCLNFFNGTISFPRAITMNGSLGSYEIGIDYYRTEDSNDRRGNVYYIDKQAINPSEFRFVEGETVSFIVRGFFSDFGRSERVTVTAYHSDVSDCDILFRPGEIPEDKRLELNITGMEDAGDHRILLEFPIPSENVLGDSFGKLFINHATSPESSEYYSVPNLIVADMADELFCGRDVNDFDNVMLGTAANDSINGTGADDLIRGFGGDDTLDGKGGNDCIAGAGGNDVIRGGDGDDAIYGGIGNDSLYGNDGNDILYGNEGDDLMSGGEGDDYLAGKSGNDHIYGNNGNDKIFGNGGDDFLKGGDGDDIMFGGEGHDALLGNTGADRLSGQGDDDALLGGRGDDRLRGGEGMDSLDGGRNRDACYDDVVNFRASQPVHCEESIVVIVDVCTGTDIEFRDIEQLPPFVAKEMLTLDSILGSYEVGLDYYVVEDGENVTYLRDSDAGNPEGGVKFQENEIVMFKIGSTSPDVVAVLLVDKLISDCDIVANPFTIPPDRKDALDVIDITNTGDFEYTVSIKIPNASDVNSNFTKLVIFYTESPETAVLYIVPKDAFVL